VGIADGHWREGVPMTATPEEKVTVPVSRDILAEVDDVVHLGPEGTVDYVLKELFLGINGHALREPIDEDTAERFVIDVVTGKLEISQIATELLGFAE
jgi:hypothetical protein